MSATDISAPVARIAALIGGVADIGQVHGHDIYDRDDMASLVTSTIGGTLTFRAWWVSGPTMSGDRAEQREAGYVRRRWVYTIYGIEGLNADGSSADTLRDNAVAVMDALDADFDLNGTCHLTEPSSIVEQPTQRLFRFGACVRVGIAKPVITLSTPS